MDQQNKGNLFIVKPPERIKQIVTIRFIEPRTDEIPAKCKLYIKKSIDGDGVPTIVLNGGYIVHPAATPESAHEDNKNKNNDAGSNQKLKLLRRGNAISGAPISNGTNQFPKPPIKRGIAAKNIIINP